MKIVTGESGSSAWPSLSAIGCSKGLLGFRRAFLRAVQHNRCLVEVWKSLGFGLTIFGLRICFGVFQGLVQEPCVSTFWWSG